jgi:hypothetical protein
VAEVAGLLLRDRLIAREGLVDLVDDLFGVLEGEPVAFSPADRQSVCKGRPSPFGPWISFHVRIDRWRKLDPIMLVSNCATWSGWQADLPQVFRAIAGRSQVMGSRSCP